MAFTRTQADLTWTAGGYVTTPDDFKHLGEKVFRGVNGTRGGAWNPSAAIAFPAGPFSLEGPLLIAYGGSVLTDSVQLVGSDTWPEFDEGHALRSRTILQDFLQRQTTEPRDWAVDTETMALQSVSIGIQPSDRSAMLSPARIRVPVEVHDKSTLARVTVNFDVPVKRNAVPLTMPRFRMVRTDQDGTIVVLASTAIADANGWQSIATVQSVDAWYASGVPQSFTFECDQNNAVDVSLYAYWLELEEEGIDPRPVAPATLDGVGTRERKLDVDLMAYDETFQTQLVGQVLDGVTTTAGMRVLVNRHQGHAQGQFQNGIWIVRAADWVRANDFDALDRFTQGAYVAVTNGDRWKGTTWELATPHPLLLVDTDPFSHDGDVRFRGLVPTGNRYHSFSVGFEDITHLRWQ